MSAERLSDSEYKQKAEENMVNMIKEKEANQKNFRLTNTVGAMSSIVFIALMMIIAFYGNVLPKVVSIALVTIAIGVFAVGMYVATQGERTIGYYKCPDCDEYFVPSYGEYMKGMHFWTTRRLKCPHCNQKVWAKKLMSKE